MAARTASSPKAQENRRGAILDAAARAFAVHGFAGASVREIAASAEVQPSSLYYFFQSKEDLYEAVYQLGVQRVLDAVRLALSTGRDPWQRLELAAIAHLETLLDTGDYNTLVASIPPKADGELERRLTRHRDEYEALFADLVERLPLRPDIDRKVLRLTLLSALNGVPSWYHEGTISPSAIAIQTVGFFRNRLDTCE
jgi:AcrR family transcriptional regulator